MTDRRDFLRAGMLVGAGMALRGSAQKKPASDDLNVGIIGVGSQGRVLLNACLEISGVRFVALCDIWEYSRGYGQRYLKKYGHNVNVYENYQEMLKNEKSLDAVIVATPDWMHHEHTIGCLQCGLHVYCEKMMSNSVAKARAMVKAMKETGKLLQIGHQRRSNPRYLHALDNIIEPGKLLGRLTHANAQWNRAVSGNLGWPRKFTMTPEKLEMYGYNSMSAFRNWRWYKKYGGGPVSDLGAHQIDIFNWFFGTHPKSVMAAGGSDFYPNREWEDNVMAIYEYETKQGLARAFYQVLTTTSAGGGYAEQFMGTEGSLKMSENPRSTRIYREAHAIAWDEFAKKGIVKAVEQPKKKPEANAVDVRETADLAAYLLPVELNEPIHQPHLRNFFDAVRGKGTLNCPANEAFASEAAVFKVHEAIKAEKKLPFTPDDFV